MLHLILKELSSGFIFAACIVVIRRDIGLNIKAVNIMLRAFFNECLYGFFFGISINSVIDNASAYIRPDVFFVQLFNILIFPFVFI